MCRFESGPGHQHADPDPVWRSLAEMEETMMEADVELSSAQAAQPDEVERLAAHQQMLEWADTQLGWIARVATPDL